MGLETATYISGLNASNPVDATDLVNQGDDHLRLIKSTVLNTFPNISGAMTKTHTELNNAAILTAAANDFISTDAPDLVDNSNAINIGTLAGAHLAFGPAQVQAKASATTAANLLLNALGGSVLVGGGAAGGQTLAIDAVAGQDARLDFYEGGVAQARIFHDASINTLKIRMLNTGDLVRIEQGNAASIMAEFDPAGEASLRYADAVALRTRAEGISAQGASAISAYVRILDNAAAAMGLIGFSGDAKLQVYNEKTSGVVALNGNNSGATLTALAEFNPDGAFGLYHAGVLALQSRTGGAQIHASAANLNAILEFYDQSAVRNGYMIVNDAGSLNIRNANHGQAVILEAEDAGGTARNLFNGDPDGRASLYYAGSQKFRTHDNSATSQASGAQVRDGGGNWREIGFNIAVVSEKTATFTVDRASVGRMFRQTTAATDCDLTTASTDLAPNGAMWMLMNDSAGNITVDANAGITLNWKDAAGGSTGDRTLAAGGICTIYKRGAGSYDIWGVGLS